MIPRGAISHLPILFDPVKNMASSLAVIELRYVLFFHLLVFIDEAWRDNISSDIS